MPNLPLRPRHVRRAFHVANVLRKHGFGHFVDHVPALRALRPGIFRRRARMETPPPSAAERVRMVLDDLGPTAIKFGQLLSTRPDMFPPDLLDELVKLQDQVEPDPFDQVKVLIESELGKRIEDVFSEFASEPVAAASMAQVYLAVLAGDGRRVAVKVQRPGIRSVVETDIDIMRYMAPAVERHIPGARAYDPVGLVEEFARSLCEELDFTNEGRNADRFRRNFESDEHLCIPKVFWDFTTSRVLVTEAVDGVKITRLQRIAERGWDAKVLARIGAEAYLRQIFEHGFFHADPHPGNIFAVGPESLAFVDFGIVGRMDDQLLAASAQVLLAVVGRDLDRVIREYDALGAMPEDYDERLLRRDLSDVVERYYGAKLSHIHAEQCITDLVAVASVHNIRLPRDFVLLGKTLLVVGSLGRELDPDFDILEVARPFAAELIRKRMEPAALAEEAKRLMMDVASVARSLPSETQEILRKLRRGKLRIEFEHRGLDDGIRELDRASNRLSLALILSAILLASTMVLQLGSGGGTMWLRIGIFGYAVAGILGLVLAFSILRSGRL